MLTVTHLYKNFFMKVKKIDADISMVLRVRIFIFFLVLLIPLCALSYFFIKNFSLNIVFLSSAEPWYNKKMLSLLGGYLIGCAIIGVALLMSCWGIRRESPRYSFYSSHFFSIFIFLSFFALLTIVSKQIFFLTPNAFILFLYIFFPHKLSSIINGINFSYKVQRPKFQKILLFLVMIGCFGYLIILYRDITFRPEVVLNPYYRIPEFYKITSQQSDKFINTTEIINQFHLRGGHSKYDFLSSNWKDNPACFQTIPQSPELQTLNDKYSLNQTFEVGDAAHYRVGSKIYPPIVVYREDQLCIFPAESISSNAEIINRQFKETLKKDVPLFSLPGNEKKLDEILFEESELILSEFIHDMNFSDYLQIIFRGNLKHQQHIYLPALEYQMGKPLGEITHQYGLGQTLLFSLLCNIFSPDGLVDYGVFISTYPWFLYVAFLLYFIGIYLLFKELKLIIIPLLLMLYTCVATGFEGYFVTGGYTTLRTILFPLIFYLIYIYYNTKNNNYFILLLIFIFLQTFLNFEFGLVTLISLLATQLINWCFTRRKDDFFKFVLVFITMVAAKIFIDIGPKTISSVFLLGLFSWIIPSKNLVYNLCVFILSLVFFLHMNVWKSKYTYVYFYSLCIRQLLIIYYFWSGLSNHLTIHYVYIYFPYVIYVIFLFKERFLKPHLLTAIVLIVSIIISGQIYRSTTTYTQLSSSYKKFIRNVKLFEWDEPGTHFKSPMNPAFFEDSISLINKYIPTNQKKIYMISQYDSFFTLLTRKISGLPHFDLVPYLMTTNEKNKIIEIFLEKKPKYIFVDRDINIPYEFDIVPIRFGGPHLHAESKLRALSLNEIREVFYKIKEFYTPIESSQLLTVYERKK